MNLEKPLRSKPDFRFEKKFVAHSNDLVFIENYLFSNGASTIYEPRWINNIYTDFDDMRSLQENVDGLSERIKTRFRWYGNEFGRLNITAEQKIKSDDVNRKNSLNLGEFDFQNHQDTAKLFSEISERVLALDHEGHFWNLIQQHPTLVNRYHRTYYMSLDNQVRITIDTDLHYYNCQFETESQQDHIIIELKSPSENMIHSDLLPLQLGKSSKYVEGMISTDPDFTW